MVALREKITAWLFVLNSCLRASNCSRRFSSPRAGCQPPACFLATAPSQQEAQRGDLSPDPPTASHRASACSPPSVAPAKTVSQAPCSSARGRGHQECTREGCTATGKEKRSPLGHFEPGMGQHSLAGASQLHAAPCVVVAACQGHPCQMLHQCGFAAGDVGIWPQRSTEVSRLAPDLSSPCRGKLPAT